MVDQQQHSSSLQAGQSIADGASRHSSGEQPQSAQRKTIFVVIDDEGTVLSYTQSFDLIRKVRFGQAYGGIACFASENW